MSTTIYNIDLGEGQTKETFIEGLKKIAKEVDPKIDHYTVIIFSVEIHLNFKDKNLTVIV